MKFASTQVIALTNQKGGCGKTTSSVSLAAAFQQLGYSVALVDTDPQCNATTYLGVNPDELYNQGNLNLLDAYLNKRAAIEIQIGFGERFDNRLFVIPGNRNLGSVGPQLDLEVQVEVTRNRAALVDAEDLRNEQKFRLRRSVDSLRGVHDIVIVDTPPDLDFLMTTALIAADWFIIPVFPSAFDLDGLEILTRTINKIRQRFNPDLKLAGVLLGAYDKTTNLHPQIHALLSRKFGSEAVFQTTIGRSVKVQESTLVKKTVFEYEPAALQAEQFLALAKEMINRASKGKLTSKPLPQIETVLENAANAPQMEITPEMLEVSNG